MATISVVIPVYNVEKYLHECVDSMLAQTYPAHEIILVDDGSKDNSGTICDAYAAAHSCIKVVHKVNAGLGMARNTGLDHVTGEYVVFIDSDDYCSPDFLEQLEGARASNDCDTCKSCFDRVDMEGNFLSVQSVDQKVFRANAVERELLARMIGSAPDRKDSLPPSSCSTLYSMEIIRANGLRFVSEREWISEDMIFNIEYYHMAKNVVLTDYIGYHYRINPHSLTTSYRADRFEKCLAMVQKEEELLRENGIFEHCRHRLYRQFFIYLRMCFSQLKSSPLTPRERRAALKRMCRDSEVRSMIADYPIGSLGFKQRMFIYLVKFRQIRVLSLLFCK